MSRELPRIEVKPVIGNLNLIPIHDLLLENPITISKPITPSRKIERGHGIKETSSKSSQPTIPKRSIMFLLNNILNSKPEICKTLFTNHQLTLSSIPHRPKNAQNIPLATFFNPTFNIALSRALPIKNSKLR
jgi:hypothetical protein